MAIKCEEWLCNTILQLISLYSYKTSYVMNMENMVDIQSSFTSFSEKLWMAMLVKWQQDEWEKIVWASVKSQISAMLKSKRKSEREREVFVGSQSKTIKPWDCTFCKERQRDAQVCRHPAREGRKQRRGAAEEVDTKEVEEEKQEEMERVQEEKV